MSELHEEAFLTEEEERFEVDSDQKAEWCLNKIREAYADQDKWLEFYKAQGEKVKATCERRVAFFENLLQHYFFNVPHKETKTQQSYQLPSGKLIMKKQGPEFERNDDELLPWLKENIPALVKVKETPDWANLKKHLTIVGDQAVDPDGEIVPGVTVTERPEKFVVEVK